MSAPFRIKKILQEKTITDFLENRNIFPVKKHSDKWVYKCPVHEGDNDPSFVVYLATEEHPQNCYCYGCHVGTSIINLVSEMDDIPIKKAIVNLLEGMEIKDDDVFKAIIEDFNKHATVSPVTIDELVLRINRICYEFLKHVNFDKEEIRFFDGVYKIVDEVGRAKDFDTLQSLYEVLVDKGISYRATIFAEKEEKAFIDKLSSKN